MSQQRDGPGNHRPGTGRHANIDDLTSNIHTSKPNSTLTKNKLSFFPKNQFHKRDEEEVKFGTGGMSADTEEQEDELLALQSIFSSDEFVRDEPKAAGEIRVSVELPAGFTVAMKEGKISRIEKYFLLIDNSRRVWIITAR